MIDYMKIPVYNQEALNNIRNNDLLKFKKNGDKEKAKYNGLTFDLHPATDKLPIRCMVRGSLHYWKNKGLHNADDFTFDEFGYSILELDEKFGINCDYTGFSRLEYGVNIVLPFDVEMFLASIILYRGSRMIKIVKQGKNGERFVELGDYLLKLYNKSKQFPQYTEENTLRVEISTQANRIRTYFGDTKVVKDLSDLLCLYTWEFFVRELPKVFGLMLIYEDIDIIGLCDSGKMTAEEANLLISGRIPEYWNGINGMVRTRTLNKFQRLIDQHATLKRKDVVMELIKSKIIDLCAIEGENMRYCYTNTEGKTDVSIRYTNTESETTE